MLRHHSQRGGTALSFLMTRSRSARPASAPAPVSSASLSLGLRCCPKAPAQSVSLSFPDAGLGCSGAAGWCRRSPLVAHARLVADVSLTHGPSHVRRRLLWIARRKSAPSVTGRQLAGHRFSGQYGVPLGGGGEAAEGIMTQMSPPRPSPHDSSGRS